MAAQDGLTGLVYMAGKKTGSKTRTGRKAKSTKAQDGQQKARRDLLLRHQWDWSPAQIYKELSKRFDVSRETIRQDIVWLTELCVKEFEAGEEREVSRLYSKLDQTARLFERVSIGSPVINPTTGQPVTIVVDEDTGETAVVLEHDSKAASVAIKARQVQSRLMGTRGTVSRNKMLDGYEQKLMKAKAEIAEQEAEIGRQQLEVRRKELELRQKSLDKQSSGRGAQALDVETRSQLVRAALLGGKVEISEVLTRFSRAKRDTNAAIQESQGGVSVDVDVSVSVAVDPDGLRGDQPF